MLMLILILLLIYIWYILKYNKILILGETKKTSTISHQNYENLN